MKCRFHSYAIEENKLFYQKQVTDVNSTILIHIHLKDQYSSKQSSYLTDSFGPETMPQLSHMPNALQLSIVCSLQNN